MKTGFKDRLEPKAQKPKDKPNDGKNYPFGWDFTCPHYDQRSSCFVKAGTDYGQAHAQPVGHKGSPKSKVDVLPYGRVETIKLYEK